MFHITMTKYYVLQRENTLAVAMLLTWIRIDQLNWFQSKKIILFIYNTAKTWFSLVTKMVFGISDIVQISQNPSVNNHMIWIMVVFVKWPSIMIDLPYFPLLMTVLSLFTKLISIHFYFNYLVRNHKILYTKNWIWD